MKTQIRKGLYETNSSSVHTLTIAKPGTKLDMPMVKGTLKFGWTADGEKRTTPAIDDCWYNEKCTFEDRLSMVHELCIARNGAYPISEFFERRNIIKATFEKLGFKCEFNDDNDYIRAIEDAYPIFHWDYDLFGDEDFMLRFVFSDKTKLDSHDNNWYYYHDYEVKNQAEESGCDLYVEDDC